MRLNYQSLSKTLSEAGKFVHLLTSTHVIHFIGHGKLYRYIEKIEEEGGDRLNYLYQIYGKPFLTFKNDIYNCNFRICILERPSFEL